MRFKVRFPLYYTVGAEQLHRQVAESRKRNVYYTHCTYDHIILCPFFSFLVLSTLSNAYPDFFGTIQISVRRSCKWNDSVTSTINCRLYNVQYLSNIMPYKKFRHYLSAAPERETVVSRINGGTRYKHCLSCLATCSRFSFLFQLVRLNIV